MTGTGNRTLRLLSLLQNRRHWAGAELAERLDVSLRTLRRDVDRLRDLGYPVEAQPGVDGGYRLAPGAVLPPLVLDDEEAVALVVGLQAAAQSAIAGTAESSVRALTKVVQVLPPRLRRRADALRTVTEPASWRDGAAAVDPEVLTTVAQACRDTERLAFGYTAADGAPTEREVEPARLVSLGRRWYLVAYDLGRGDWRSFRLDRLTGPRPTGARFAPRRLPAEDAAAFVRAGTGPRATPVAVEALVAAPADRVRARIGRWARVIEERPGHSRVHLETDSLDWPAFALGSLGAEFTVVTPPELRELLGEWAGRFGRAAVGIDSVSAGPGVEGTAMPG
ncbi:helix-turn-helix transcriptional regulator [Geodermatophilus sabuli]|uniref:Predicted DNA-binding transcriptional regulator YafY, contains an HTH and WYL domains n=1 Tax=Geodermatophilus sabuli TaxID=1564158 RepID=A0A285EFJ3_9ACTN|nr:YafY family protein [Geodermatophilus sabuli]MBB3086523.1 putative DNA-binding transcriptional regulator YafY [Geodermatophilus sabuli]SNX97825.1 Predicted DNA-binding transcriptional regulator YafY, contains an HTH and WYL domains [Geodermatophilus sabuli]